MRLTAYCRSKLEAKSLQKILSELKKIIYGGTLLSLNYPSTQFTSVKVLKYTNVKAGTDTQAG